MDVEEGRAVSMGVYDHLQIFVKLFRFTELCVALAFFFWTFTRLPMVLRVSTDFVSQLSGFFASPVFGFILCNTIVVALIAKPHRFSGYNLSGDSVETELFNEELAKNGAEDTLSFPGNKPNGRLSSDPDPEEIEYEDKEVISEVSTTAAFTEKMDDTGSGLGRVSPMPQYRRIKSDKMQTECSEVGGEKFRRLEAEEKETVRRGGEVSPESVWYGEELSNNEFQQRIEAFIARELKFRREESGAVVLRSESCLEFLGGWS